MTSFNAIIHLCDKRKQNKITSVCALLSEIQSLTKLPSEQLSKELRELHAMEVIKIYRTLNSISFVLVE